MDVSHPTCLSPQLPLFFRVPLDLNCSKFCCKLSQFLWKEMWSSLCYWPAFFPWANSLSHFSGAGGGTMVCFSLSETPNLGTEHYVGVEGKCPGSSWLPTPGVEFLLYKPRQERTGTQLPQHIMPKIGTFLSRARARWEIHSQSCWSTFPEHNLKNKYWG